MIKTHYVTNKLKLTKENMDSIEFLLPRTRLNQMSEGLISYA